MAPLTVSKRAEVGVVGAGYTGLSAALHLAEAGRSVVVLERGEVGAGASGRNGGQVIPGLKHDPDFLEELFGAELGPRLVATVGSGADMVFDLIERQGIACEAVRSGWMQLATTESALGGIQSRASQWRRRGAPVDLLSRSEATRLSGSARYVGGWIDRRAGTLQPLSYVRGLARAVQRAGAEIYTQSPAQRLRRSGTQWHIETPGGTLACDTVLIATNAYSEQLTQTLGRTFVAVPSFQVATAPMPPHLRATVLPERQAVSDTWRLLRYFRLDGAGRLIMGARGTFGTTSLRKTAEPHYRAVREIYPQLSELPFEYHWGGLVAMTPDHLPHVHELAPGLRTGLGYNGRGVAMATVMGRILARWVMGEDPAEAGFRVSSAHPIPFHGVSRWGTRLAIQYLRALDAWEGAIAPRRRSRSR